MTSPIPTPICEAFATEIGNKAEQLSALVKLMQTYGKVVNLTGSLDAEDIWMEVAEALLAFRALQACASQEHRWLDIGSGGGLPGLVFAVLLRDEPQSEGLLVEPRKRRVDFLSLASAQLGLSNLEILQGKLDESGCMSPKSTVDSPSWVSARAVFSPEEWRRRAGLAWPSSLCMVHGRCQADGGEEPLHRSSWNDIEVEIWPGLRPTL